MSTPARLGGAQPGILTLNIKDKSALYVAYMPFVKNGGLFIPTTKEYRLGDEVFILLTLMENPERLPVAGKVVWVTPKGAQGKRLQGIGVQFSPQDNGATQQKIESQLAGALGADRPTHTM
ncbi:PilZ domain-containing protein [Stenotrophobium rhamnosiphilum]|uniref:Pilus assembly protein PilZ n=1 Tax=Stenotrophobium rhamnosiphilum TaxID=2029166 RepID=A0A2T5MIU5_9GAMM|nr:PilZ domain-containing protein [Stenotrophobium rhamnosiphilum]PTU32495.1 pilus assembly protein PilZ [Stenotrophobium rhamnosiphilum]